MSRQTETGGWEPWANRASFTIVSAAYYLTAAAMIVCLYYRWWLPLVPLVLLSSHLMHAMLLAFHEAAHGILRKNRVWNEFDGLLVAACSLSSLTLYRVLHQQHHVNVATVKDVELWPFVDPKQPLWWRRLAAFLELNFGFFYTPWLFWRFFFVPNSPITNRRARRRIWLEFWLMVVFWTAVLWFVARFDAWIWFLVLYFIPAFIAGNMQSWRKYIEHVGLCGNTGRSATRSILNLDWKGKFVSVSLLHQPLHGVHHVKGSLPYHELPNNTHLIVPTDEGDTVPFPNYRAAFADLFKCLADPRVGSQWNVSPAA
ncbi:MAG: fatty acid desaturase [Chthoniobacterales bacterium]|nr:fatty acid desaturase [Chthoniobacterales bacterium]